jgi:outer membrane protein OmpA-like peptidoglycan-associated protein
MKRLIIGAALLAAAPLCAQAQTPLQPGGFYIGVEGGGNWLLNNTYSAQGYGNAFGGATSFQESAQWNTGFVVGGSVGYDFVGPRVELEGVYRENTGTLTSPGAIGSLGANFNQVSIMGNVLYDFMAGSTIVPYIGAGAGVAFQNFGTFGTTQQSTQFAYQGIIGVGYNIDPTFRLNLEGRYYGTLAGTFSQTTFIPGAGSNTIVSNPQNNNFSAMINLQMRFGAAAPPPPPPPPPMVAPPSFMVFFDWDRSNLSQQALTTIGQAASAFKTKGNARITATGHTDTSGPESYNMALSLRRANAVKDALVRNGVPAQAITVIGRGEAGLLVQTGDGVREPQNRRVEIVIQ